MTALEKNSQRGEHILWTLFTNTTSALALDCLCKTGLTPWSVLSPFPRTILLYLLLCKIIFPGPVGALGSEAGPVRTTLLMGTWGLWCLHSSLQLWGLSRASFNCTVVGWVLGKPSAVY